RLIVRTQHHAIQRGRTHVLWRCSCPASRRQRQQECHSQEQCASHFFNLFGVSFLERRKEAKPHRCIPRSSSASALSVKRVRPGVLRQPVECASPSTCLIGQVSSGVKLRRYRALKYV